MITSLIGALALRSLAQGEGKRVDLALIALSLDCPKEWVVTTDKKKNVKIVFQIPSGSTAAAVEIFPTNFVEEKDRWQLIQAEFARTSKRELVRQWEEEVLGVPLLLTRVNYSEGGNQKTAVNGLLYNDSARKMWYRITAAPEDFDNADYAWRTVLQTMRTFSGSALKAQVPGVKPDPKKPVDDLPTKPPTVTQIDDPTKHSRAEVRRPFKSLDVVIANRKVSFQYPDNLRVEQAPTGVIQLFIPNVSSPLLVNLFSTLDSDPSERALFKASSESLNKLLKVERRDESGPTKSISGADLHTIWRRGTGQSGILTCLDAVVSLDAFYALISWSNPGTSISERQAIDAALRQLSVVAAP